MAPSQWDDWTVVSGRRRQARGDIYYSAPRPGQYPERYSPTQKQYTYADAVKSGAYRRPIPAYRKDNHQWSARPQLTRLPAQPAPGRSALGRYVPRTGPKIRVCINTEGPGPLKQKGANCKQDTAPQRNPEFTQMTRNIFRFIKLVHHKNNVQNGQPHTITRLQHFLAGVIKPAITNPETQALIAGNAENWAYTSTLILQQHYEEALRLEKEKLEELPFQHVGDHFRVAIVWAKRAFGKRLREETLSEVRAFLEDWYELDPSPPASEDSHPLSPRDGGDDPADGAEPPMPPEHAPQVQASSQVGPNMQPHPPSSNLAVTGELLQTPTALEPPSDLAAPSPPVAKVTRTVPTMAALTCPESPRREAMADGCSARAMAPSSPSTPRRTLSPERVASLKRAIQTRLDMGLAGATPTNSQSEVQDGLPKRSLRLLAKRTGDMSDTQTFFRARKAHSIGTQVGFDKA